MKSPAGRKRNPLDNRGSVKLAKGRTASDGIFCIEGRSLAESCELNPFERE
jgi:hypothetical protein